MTALAADRNTRNKHVGRSISLLVAASTTIYKGALVCVNNTGYAVAGAKTAGYKVVGVADEQVDNSAGSDGDLSVRVRKGVFAFKNDTDAVAQSHIGRPCFVVDDQTVADEAEGSSVVAGLVEAIDANDEIWVSIIDEAMAALAVANCNAAVETVTSGALSLYTKTSFISCTGTQAYTLAAGLYQGQEKIIKCSVAASTPIGTLTPSTYADGTTIVFSYVGQTAHLIWDDTNGWTRVDALYGNARQAITETVTSGAVSLTTLVTYVSVTGTQAYTLADGLYQGQQKFIKCTVAASTPVGTLTPVTFADGTSVLFDAVDEWIHIAWDDVSGWTLVQPETGATVS